jgi:hypothetical protein
MKEQGTKQRGETKVEVEREKTVKKQRDNHGSHTHTRRVGRGAVPRSKTKRDHKKPHAETNKWREREKKRRKMRTA